MLRRVKYILNRNTLQKLYFLYDQSKNSKPIYGSTIQNTMYLVNKIEHIHVQLKSVRIVMGDGLASRYLLYKATEWNVNYCQNVGKSSVLSNFSKYTTIWLLITYSVSSSLKISQSYNWNTKAAHPLREINSKKILPSKNRWSVLFQID